MRALLVLIALACTGPAFAQYHGEHPQPYPRPHFWPPYYGPPVVAPPLLEFPGATINGVYYPPGSPCFSWNGVAWVPNGTCH